jgi:hypothetical protein
LTNLYFSFWLPLPSRSIGIIGLGENRKINLGAQQLRGKILSDKELPLASAAKDRARMFQGLQKNKMGVNRKRENDD